MIRFVTLLLCAGSAVWAIGVATPDRPPLPPTAGAPDSRGKPASLGGPNWFGEPRALLIRGDRLRIGRFDRDGNFIPDAEITRLNSTPLGGPNPSFPVNGTGGRFVYEHRSGRLISGRLVTSPTGVFVPEIGSTILDLKKDYDTKAADRMVYNLRETLRKSPVAPDPPKAGQPAGWKLLRFRDLYPDRQECANPWFARVIGKVMELGHLSDEGEFIPDYGLPIFPYVKVKAKDVTHDVLQNGSHRPFYYTLPVVDALYGNNNIKVGADAEGVYEYRSGRLIQGTLQKTGNFVPDLGSKIIDFKDYDPAPPRKRRIYNLPGVLRKIQEPKP